MSNGVKDVSLVPADEPQQPPMLPMIERLAALPDFDVTKLAALLDMQERILNRNAEAAFNAAFAQMQSEIPEITEKGKIMVKGELQSRYARNEDIQKVLKPILKAHGFTLSFQTEWQDSKAVKVIGILTHREGHSRKSEFLSAADTSGNKNAIQALGSAVSYGHRYTTIDLLNITSRGQDDDGEKTELANAPEAPAGFESWMLDMEAVVQEGIAKWQDAWNKSNEVFRKYCVQHHKQGYERMRAQAKAAVKS